MAVPPAAAAAALAKALAEANEAEAARKRAIGVWFKDLQRWDYGFFRRVRWHWPKEQMAVLGSVLVRKQLEVDSKTDKAALPIIGKISFGGIISISEVEDRIGYKGRLFWANTGDLIYSKIRVKQGSLAVVPADIPSLAVSAEYPVYSIRSTVAEPTYLALVLKTKNFLSIFEGISHGGSTKTRIPPEEFERQEIPLPPMAEQRAIIARWREAQEEIVAARERVEKQKAAMETRFFVDLGLKPPEAMQHKGAFAVWWKDIEKWGVQQIHHFTLRPKQQAKYKEVLLSELCKIGSGGTPFRRNNTYFGGSIPWVKTTEVKNEEITSTEETLTEEGLKNSSAKIYPKGSLIIAMYGQGATRGRTAKLGIDAATNQACAVLSNISKDIETNFLWYFLMSQYEAMRALASGNNQPNLNADMIANLKIPVPPLPVQREIMERVASGRAEIIREREAAERLAEDISCEVEAMMLGTKPAKG